MFEIDSSGFIEARKPEGPCMSEVGSNGAKTAPILTKFHGSPPMAQGVQERRGEMAGVSSAMNSPSIVK